MRIRAVSINQLIKDEYIYKKITIFFGILYWLYGLMPITDAFFNVISILNVLFVFYVFYKGEYDYIKKYAILIFLTGLISALVNEFRTANIIAVAYGLIETALMTYCSNEKKENQLIIELTNIAKMILRVGTIIIVLSLAIFFSGIHKTYYYTSVTTTTLHLGRDTTTGALTGVLSNANIAADFFVIYLGMLLFVVTREKLRIRHIILGILCLTALLFTYSRGGYIGAIALFGIWFAFNLFFKCQLKYGMPVLIGTGFFLIICVIFAYFGGAFRFGSFSIGGRDAAQMGRNTDTRVLLWIAGFKSVMSSPKNFFFGAGNEIKGIIAEFVPFRIDKGLFNNMHNIYIQILVGFGVCGLVLFLLFVFTILSRAIRRLFSQGARSKDMIPIMGLSIAFLIINIVESDMFYKKAFEGTLIWVCLGYMNKILELRSTH